MKLLFNNVRLKLALLLLTGLPENTWIGRHTGAYTREQQWSAGSMDSRGVLQGFPLGQVFENRIRRK